jgi:hypothetical protein
LDSQSRGRLLGLVLIEKHGHQVPVPLHSRQDVGYAFAIVACLGDGVRKDLSTVSGRSSTVLSSVGKVDNTHL